MGCRLWGCTETDTTEVTQQQQQQQQASLSITNSWSSLKLTSIESVMPSSHVILCYPLLLRPLIPPSINVFSNESTLCMRWPKYCSFSFSISPSSKYSGLVSWVDKLFSIILVSILSHWILTFFNTRLRRPWDSPGKSTGVGCHCLLQCMKVKSESEVTQSCPTLRDPMDCSLTGSSVHGIFQARVLEWVAIAFSEE